VRCVEELKDSIVVLAATTNFPGPKAEAATAEMILYTGAMRVKLSHAGGSQIIRMI
jgi:hypothetical protein